MAHCWKVTLAFLLSCCVASSTLGQGMGALASGPPGKTRAAIAEPSSQTAQMARDALDVSIELGEIKCELGSLGDLLTERLEETPVFVDQRALEMAELSTDAIIEATLAKLPLRSALRHLLQPHGLRAVVEEEGLVITADFAEVTRHGVATSRWVDERSQANESIWSALGKSVSLTFVDTPLDEALADISEKAELPIVVDSRALEEIGLETTTPVSLNLKNVTLRSCLRLMLRGLDLTFMIKDEVMQITTREAAEQNLINRIYFLEGTGIPIGDFQSAIDVIQTTVEPNTWEALGGPSTVVPIQSGIQSRPSLVISATSDIHEQIESLLQSMRESQVGPDLRLNDSAE